MKPFSRRNTASSGQPPPRRRTWRFAGAALTALSAVLVYGCTGDQMGTAPTVPDTKAAFAIPAGELGYDLNDPAGSPVNVNGALWFLGVELGVGTGLIDPFLSIQAGGTEEGFNTDFSPLPLDDTRPQFTDALPLNNIPIIKNGNILYRQFILDANEANSGVAQQFSIDFFDLYLCLDEAGTTIPMADEIGDFANNLNCQIIYDFEPGFTGFATDGLTQGSGSTLDYDILIPEAFFDAFGVGQVTVDDCPYNPLAPDCGLYVVLHTAKGGFGGDWVTGSTFEEYSTVLQPFVEVQKTAVPTFTRRYLWQIEKAVDPSDIYLFEGQSQDANYTVTVTQDGVEDSGWNVSGVVTITNPSDADAEVTSVVDVLQPGAIPITLDCATPFTLAGGASIDCNYSHNFNSDPGAVEFTNTVEIELAGLAVTTGESETFAFGDPTTEIDQVVDVEDFFDNAITDLLADDISAGDVFNYTRTFTCDQDDGGHPNTASVIGDGGAGDVLDEASANVDVHCLDVTVTKDAATALERTYLWDIDKSVTPDTWDLFQGDDGTSKYTITVTPDGTEDADFMVEGNINVTNPNDVSVFITNITDAISGVGAISVTSCEVSAIAIDDPPYAAPGYELAAGETIICEYSSTLPDDQTRTNTATATAKPTAAGTAKDFTGDASVDFTGVVLTEVNKEVNVTDTNGDTFGPFDHDDGAAMAMYERNFTCADEGDNPNTATIDETGQNDDASVTVTCYELRVTKDATTEWTRTWTWDIDKVIDPTHFLDGTYDAATNTATVMENTTLEVKYDITLNATPMGSDWNVSGNINVSNSGNPIAAVINSVTDIVSPALAATVSCGVTFPHTIAAGGSLACTYTVDLPDANMRDNTATAVQQNFSYASDLTATPNGTMDQTGTADVEFSATPTFEIDECVTVLDVLSSGGLQVGEVLDVVDGLPPGGAAELLCAAMGASQFPLSIIRTFGPDDIPLECGDNMFDNTATFTTNDTSTEGSDPADINIVVECIVGCTLTQGYWKTHNDMFAGGASKKADPTWALVGGPGASFFGGESWFDVFWTAPKGNQYYNLAHQYMAAVLNGLAGASTTAVDAELAAAQLLFETYTPEQVAGFKGRNGREIRAQFVSLAGILASYNEGDIGPGHCTENGN